MGDESASFALLSAKFWVQENCGGADATNIWKVSQSINEIKRYEMGIKAKIANRAIHHDAGALPPFKIFKNRKIEI